MRVSRIAVRETREIGPFSFRRVEIEVSVLKDDNVAEARVYAAAQLQWVFEECQKSHKGYIEADTRTREEEANDDLLGKRADEADLTKDPY